MRTKITQLGFLLAVLSAGVLHTARAQTVYVPATVTGYTEDVIADGGGGSTVASSTTNTVDRGIPTVKWCFANTTFPGLNASNALPASGTITSISTPGLTFQMAPATVNNSLRIAGDNRNNPAILTLTNPQPCSEVMVLATEGNGTTAADKIFIVNFTDGTNQQFNGVTVPDWFNGTITPAINVGSRVSYVTNAIDLTPNNPRLYEVRLNLSVANYSKSVQSITVIKSAVDPVLNVMGISLGSNCLGVPLGGTAIASATSVCPGLPVVLGLTGASSTGGITYQWQASTNGGTTFTNIAGATTTIVTVNPTVATQYRAVVTCRLQGSNSTTVSVAVLPTVATVAYTAAPQPATFCAAGTAPVLTATPAGGTFSSTTGLVINATTGTINLATSTPGTYTVTYRVASACNATGTTTVTINRPVATLDYSQARYCRNGSNATPAFTPAGGTFSNPGTGLVLNATTGVIDVRASQTGRYLVRYTSGGTCSAIAEDSVTISETTATLAYVGSPYCRTGNGAPTATPAGGTFSATPAGLAINATSGVIDLPNSAAGTYSVTYLSGGFCPATATASVVVKSDALPTFPNVLTANADGKNDELKLTIGDVTGYHIRVFNRWGRKVYEGHNAAQGWKAEDNSAGMYYYQVEYADCAGRPQQYKSWVEVVK